MAERVARDVAPYEPNKITVMLGMNDGGWGYGSPQQIDADFQARYNTLLRALHQTAPDADLTLISSTPYDEITHGTEFPGYSRMIDRLANDVSQIAAQKDAGTFLFADFHLAMQDALERAKASEPKLASLLIPDRIHPAKTSHWIMAVALMEAWHVNPVVSSVSLNADGKVIASDRAQVSNLVKSSAGLQWTQLDEALHLALQKTPMLEQAREIDSIEEQRAELDHARFMLGADVKPIPTTSIAEATIRAAQTELDQKVRKQLSPRPHQFELRLVQ